MSKKNRSRPASPAETRSAPEPEPDDASPEASAPEPEASAAADDPAQAPGAEDHEPSAPEPEPDPRAMTPVEEPAAEPPPAPPELSSPAGEPEGPFAVRLAVIGVREQGFRRFGYHFTRVKTFLAPDDLTKEQLLELKRLHDLRVISVEVCYPPHP